MRTLTTMFILAMLSVFYSPTKAVAQDGKTLYEGKCKTCHGVDGKGLPLVAKMYKIDQDLLDFTNEKSKKITDAEMTKVVRRGQGKMKPIPSDKLSNVELKAVISHVRTLQK
ncbi:MAG: cytochrome c [bacterium]|nr:cytochrome c [bacterium]